MRATLKNAVRYAWILLAVLLVACGPDRVETTIPDQDLGPIVEDVVETYQHDANEGLQRSSLTGTWAKLDQTATCVLVIGAAIESLSFNLDLVEMREEWRSADGTQAWVTMSSHPCRKTMTPIILSLAANVPPKVLAATEASKYACLLEAPEGKPFPLEGDVDLTDVRMTCEPYTQTWGLHLKDPFHDDVPALSTDPRVYDQEGDGYPGMTLTLGDNLCQMYVVQRALNLLGGVLQKDHLDESFWRSEVWQQVLEIPEGLCGTQNESFTNHPRSRVYLVRVDGYDGAFDTDENGDGTIECAELNNQTDAVYARYGVVTDEADSSKCPKP